MSENVTVPLRADEFWNCKSGKDVSSMCSIGEGSKGRERCWLEDSQCWSPGCLQVYCWPHLAFRSSRKTIVEADARRRWPGFMQLPGDDGAHAHGGAATAVPGATLRVTQTSTGKAWVTWTDDTGKFEFPGLPAGHYRVEISQLGFAPATKEIDLASGAQTPVDLNLDIGTLAAITAPPAVESAAKNPHANTPAPDEAAKAGTSVAAPANAGTPAAPAQATNQTSSQTTTAANNSASSTPASPRGRNGGGYGGGNGGQRRRRPRRRAARLSTSRPERPKPEQYRRHAGRPKFSRRRRGAWPSRIR